MPALQLGSYVGTYEILALIGAGGMGEVYRARDNKLKREVAIKVLPEAFSRDTERVARFQREAEVLASLNHPHIAAIYDLAEFDSSRLLVLELVEGETLADRIARGPIPVDQALPIAKQIAEALEAAHEKGIIHRDLKPANIKITSDGKVKVLDFGLAKAFSDEGVNANLSNSPTVSMAMTNAGVILGTAAYMSPEQAKGVHTDSRSDVFSFGCVLYEMLTGRQAFQGETVSDVMASVLAREPEFNLVPPHLNPRLYDLLRRCLEKSPKRRWHAVGDLWAELEIVAANPFHKPEAIVVAEPQLSPRRSWVLRSTAVILVTALAIPAFLYFRGSPPPDAVRFEIPVPSMQNAYQIAVSPDGRKVAFVASGDGNINMLFVRPIDSISAQPLAGTEGANEPFWSADSRYIGFSTDSALKKVEAMGGPPQVLCNISVSAFKGSGTWNADGVIVFSNDQKLYRVSAAGGVPVPISSPDTALQEFSYSWPDFLPDGHHFLYHAWSAVPSSRAIYVGSLDSDQKTRVLMSDTMGAFAAPGFLIFQRQGTLFAQEFDVAALTLSGEPIPLAEGIPFSIAGGGAGRAAFAASDNGVLIYRSGTADQTQFVWFDRSGKQLATAGPPAVYGEFDLSPDGKQIAVARTDPATSARNIWVQDWIRNVSTRLTFETFSDTAPIWSPDGLTIAFSRQRANIDIFETKTSNTRVETLVLESAAGINSRIEDWSKDARYIAYIASAGLYILPLFGERKPFLIVQQADEPHFSFDGRWLAYHSSESGTSQVYMISFPAADQKIQISTNGGVQARWRQDGRELYYLALDGKLMAVDIGSTGGRPEPGSPHVLFDTRLPASTISEQYALSSDGQRFLVQMPLVASAPTPITVVINWTAAVKW